MRTILPCIGLFFLAHPAFAAIVSVGGNAAVLPIPANVSSNHFESDTTIAVFNERQGVLLSSPMAFDANVGKFYSATADLTPGTIPAGTRVNSYLVHFDKVGSSSGFVIRSGSVTVDEPVLGLMSSVNSLVASDAVVGVPGTIYGTDANRGIDFNTGDSFLLSSDLRTVSFTLASSPDEDQLRIVTVVPEPTAIGLLALAAVPLVFFRRSPARADSAQSASPTVRRQRRQTP